MSSEPLDEVEASSWAGEALLGRGGVGGSTTRTAGGATGMSAETTRWMVAGGDAGALAEPVAMMTERGADLLRGMRGRGAPAKLECRE